MDDDRQALRHAVLDVLLSVAPEVDAARLVASRPLRHQVDLDSMDWLNVLVGLHDRLGVQIPEADYARLVTLDDLLDYLGPRLPSSAE